MFKKSRKQSTKWYLLLLGMICAFILTGCASNADTLSSPGPKLNSTEMPGNQLKQDVKEMLPDTMTEKTASPTENIPASGSGMADTLEKSRQVSDEMEKAIGMLTEIEEADVVAIGNQALVGVEFTSQYRGSLDERIREMVLTRVQTISKGVNELYITDQNAMREKIELLSDRLEDASSLSDVADQFVALTQEIDVFRK